MKSKKEIRLQIETIFQNKKKQEIEDKSELITSKLLDYIKTNKYKKICIYENISNEVNTHNIIDILLDQWLSIYTPQVIWETEMILIDEEYEVYEKEIDVFIIPWRAFSSDGKRLWRGKWYYDRFLSNRLYKKSRKIWICFDFQIMDDIPTEKHDILMNKIITND